MQMISELNQANLLTDCEDSLPEPSALNGKAWLEMARLWSTQYKECKERNNTKNQIILKHNSH